MCWTWGHLDLWMTEKQNEIETKPISAAFPFWMSIYINVWVKLKFCGALCWNKQLYFNKIFIMQSPTLISSLLCSFQGKMLNNSAKKDNLNFKSFLLSSRQVNWICGFRQSKSNFSQTVTGNHTFLSTSLSVGDKIIRLN